jgi:hypothetical protein
MKNHEEFVRSQDRFDPSGSKRMQHADISVPGIEEPNYELSGQITPPKGDDGDRIRAI